MVDDPKLFVPVINI